MVFTVHFREYTFGGLRQRTLVIAGTAIRGTATEQRSGGWGWFLRYPDGELAGEGHAATWDGLLEDIVGALVMETKYGRLSYPTRDAAP